MNAYAADGLRHYVVQEPRVHPINPDHVVLMGRTECGLPFTWLTGPRYLPNGPEHRMIPSPHVPTCLTCWWEKEH